MNAPELCSQCGGKCCTNPFLTNDEYMRLYTAVGDKKILEADPKYIAPLHGWVFNLKDGEKCPGSTETGCILPYNDRPMICKTYPFIGYKGINGVALLLAVKTCPAWEEFGARYKEAYEEYEQLSKEES